MNDESDSKIVFKTKGKRNLRQRKQSSDHESDEEYPENNVLSKLEETRERQRLRKKPHGVNIIGLANGKRFTAEEEVTNKDPFNVKSGGMVNMHALKSGKLKKVEDAYDTGIGTQFSAETNKRDEDEEMMKYIEEELGKKKGSQGIDQEIEGEGSTKYLTPEEAALLALPAHLRHGSTHRSEEMLSNQMLSGIPEVDLGIDAKIKNIEATEEAKLKFLRDQKKKKDLPSQFVPTNVASNFIQHNRFKVDENLAEKKKKYNAQEATGDTVNKGPKKATDDYHFDKFKKQFRRH